MLVGGGFYGFIIASMSSVVASRDSNALAYYEVRACATTKDMEETRSDARARAGTDVPSRARTSLESGASVSYAHARTRHARSARSMGTTYFVVLAAVRAPFGSGAVLRDARSSHPALRFTTNDRANSSFLVKP